MAVVATAWRLHKSITPIVGLNSRELIDEEVQVTELVLTEEELTKLESGYRPKTVTGC